MSENPTFVARKFEETRKLVVKGYACPFSSDTFPADQKLREHANQHGQQLDLDVADKENARKPFRGDAIPEVYVDTLCIAGHSSMDDSFFPMNVVDGSSI